MADITDPIRSGSGSSDRMTKEEARRARQREKLDRMSDGGGGQSGPIDGPGLTNQGDNAMRRPDLPTYGGGDGGSGGGSNGGSGGGPGLTDEGDNAMRRPDLPTYDSGNGSNGGSGVSGNGRSRGGGGASGNGGTRGRGGAGGSDSDPSLSQAPRGIQRSVANTPEPAGINGTGRPYSPTTYRGRGAGFDADQFINDAGDAMNDYFGSVVDRSKENVSPIVRLGLPGGRRDDARAGEADIAKQARGGDFWARLYQRGEQSQIVGTDIGSAIEDQIASHKPSEVYEKSTEKSLSTLAGQDVDIPNPVAAAWDTEIGAGGNTAREQFGSAVGGAVEFPFIVGGALPQVPGAVTKGSGDAGTFLDTTATGTKRTIDHFAENPVEAVAIFGAAGAASRGSVARGARAGRSGARSAADRAGFRDFVSDTRGQTGQGRTRGGSSSSSSSGSSKRVSYDVDPSTAKNLANPGRRVTGARRGEGAGEPSGGLEGVSGGGKGGFGSLSRPKGRKSGTEGTASYGDPLSGPGDRALFRARAKAQPEAGRYADVKSATGKDLRVVEGGRNLEANVPKTDLRVAKPGNSDTADVPAPGASVESDVVRGELNRLKEAQRPGVDKGSGGSGGKAEDLTGPDLDADAGMGEMQDMIDEAQKPGWVGDDSPPGYVDPADLPDMLRSHKQGLDTAGAADGKGKGKGRSDGEFFDFPPGTTSDTDIGSDSGTDRGSDSTTGEETKPDNTVPGIPDFDTPKQPTPDPNPDPRPDPDRPPRQPPSRPPSSPTGEPTKRRRRLPFKPDLPQGREFDFDSRGFESRFEKSFRNPVTSPGKIGERTSFLLGVGDYGEVAAARDDGKKSGRRGRFDLEFAEAEGFDDLGDISTDVVDFMDSVDDLGDIDAALNDLDI